MLKVPSALCATLLCIVACSPEAQVPQEDVTIAPTANATAAPAETTSAQASSDAAASAAPIPSDATARATIGTPDATGTSGGSVANAGSVVAGMAKDFRRCYQLALKDDPNAKGSVRISAKIGPKGEVVSATPTEAKGLPQPVILCITDVVRSRTFDAPEGGTLVIPLSFAGGQPPCDPKSDPLCTPP